MAKRNIYIICAYHQGGRFVHTAAANLRRANTRARALVGEYERAGWTVEELQTPTPPAGGVPGIAEPVAVWHLKHRRGWFGGWLNVELYRVEDSDEPLK